MPAAGAHDLAMEDAGIHEFNLIEASRPLPSCSSNERQLAGQLHSASQRAPACHLWLSCGRKQPIDYLHVVHFVDCQLFITSS